MLITKKFSLGTFKLNARNTLKTWKQFNLRRFLKRQATTSQISDRINSRMCCRNQWSTFFPYKELKKTRVDPTSLSY